MKQKQNLIILAAIGIVFLLFWLAVIMLVLKLRGSSESAEPPLVVDVTLCDENASDLCILNFGANNLNRMVIHFQLPTPNYAQFYIKATNRDTVSVYTCEMDKTIAESETANETATEVATETPTETVDKSESIGAHCTGVRTPLGETIDIEVYTTDGDKLIGRGTFLVSAIALPTPISLPSETPAPAADTAMPNTPFEEETSTPSTDPFIDVTSTPDADSPIP